MSVRCDNLSRRTFLLSIAAAGAATAMPRKGTKMIRTISYNILACAGFPERRENRLTLARFREQLPERIALELALYQPDIITFQECPREAIVAEIAQRLGMSHAYFPGGFPGAILTRFPIASSENCPLPDGLARPDELFTRHWGCATLTTPDGPLHLYSAHLHPEHQDKRLREIELMLEVMGNRITGGDAMILQGDLNHLPTVVEYTCWQAAGLEDAYTVAGEGERESYSSVRPREAIDYIWAGGTLRGRAQHYRVLEEGAFRPHPDDRNALALSDHLPVMAEFG